MTAAVLTTAPSSGSGSDNCRCPIELSSRLTGCECLILLGLGENVTYVWRWGLVQGTRHSHILKTPGLGGRDQSQVIKQTDIYTSQSSDSAIL